MAVRYPFTVEVSLEGLPGAIADVECIAISDDNGPTLGSVQLISNFWHDGKVREIRKDVPPPGQRWGVADPLLRALIPQIWEAAEKQHVADGLRGLWHMNAPSKPKLGIWEAL